MGHPFLNNRINRIIYFGVWIVVGIIHLLWLYFETHYPIQHATVDAAASTVIFSVLGLLVWPLTVYNRPGKADAWSVASSQILGATIVVGIWIFSTTYIINLFAKFYPAKVFKTYITTEQIAIGLSYYIVLFGTCYLILIYRENREKKLNEEKMQRLVRESELNALKAQINPHFLFNSLNSVNYLIGYDPERASNMLAKLSDYLRYSLRKGDEGLVTFCDELENCRKFLDMEHLRFGDKMVLQEDIDEAVCDVKVPLMILQPIYENAIKHGVYESLDPVTIKTVAQFKNNMLYIEICNTFDPEAVPRKGEGVGLQNVSDRLELVFNEKGLLKTVKEKNTFKAVITIPI
ncbi:sensor histidine kinase [Saccharicrinis sp. FJH54]|uniref:sensor histidine kinase n=1 Tax=Saccharicrinis sp. FJH54 TaxID=3344665 RepID=UPI0035D3ED2B